MLAHLKIIIIGYYRQWQLLFDNNSRGINHENKRFDIQSKLWEKLINDNVGKEIILSGDFNINERIWNKREEELTDYDKKFIPMCNMIKKEFLTMG